MFSPGKKAVDFGKSGIGSDKTNATQPKLMEIGDIEIDLGNEAMNEVANDIKFAREKVRQRINEKSPDEDKSIKSKKGQKRKSRAGTNLGGTTTSAGFGSINESQIQIDGLSGENNMNLFNNSMNDKSSMLAFSKVKPRDFEIKAKTLRQLGAQNYDAMDNVEMIKLNIEDTIKAQQRQWKTLDETRLKYLIKRQMIQELNFIEERKQVRRDQKELAKRKEEQREDAEGNEDLHAV